MRSLLVVLPWLLAWPVVASQAEEACATHLVQRKAQARFAEASSTNKKKLGDGKIWDVFDFIGAVHHKSGIYLLHKIWFYLFQGVLGAHDDDMGVIISPCYTMCQNTDAPIRWIVDMMSPELVERERASAKAKGKGLRVAGLLRNPVTMAVSGYCYHVGGAEKLNVMFMPPGWPAVNVQTMPPELGIPFVAERMLQYVKNMTDLYEQDGNAFLHYEKATSSSEAFDKEVKQFLDGLVGDIISNDEMEQALEASTWADLHRHPESAEGHTTDHECMAKTQEAFASVVQEDVLAEYRSLQKRLGYEVL